MTLPTTTPEPRPHQLPAGLTASQERALIRDGYACFRCGDHALEASVIAEARSSRADMPANRLSLCADCKQDVHADDKRARKLSIRLGYLIPAGNFNPSSIPVLHHRNGWVVLTQDGKWAKADEFAVRDWQDKWPA